MTLEPLTGFASVSALIVRRLTAKPGTANALADWKAAQRAARRQMRLTVPVMQQAAQAATQASRLAPRRPDSIGKLFDGKEIRDGGGRVVGHWRYRGGQFQPDYFS